ncbi:MAG TPA: serine/threonine-protein kinase [Candidatus Acidoferrum sp.]|nr:serine/threonine-protein kinase [Candidatus Acidoferrum sp.]
MRASKRSRSGLPPSERLACLRCRGVFRAPAGASATGRCPLDGARLHRAAGDPLLGTWFAERYLVDELVGDGPLGRVYRVRDMPERRRPVALRVLAGERAADPGARARFRRQAELARRLDHPNVVPVAGVGTSREGLPFLVTDYVAGPPLSRIVASEGPLARNRVVSILRQVASGLVHAHERGVLHRDLRPANVLVDRERGRERARIVDFAIGAPDGAADAGRDMAGLAAVLRDMLGGKSGEPGPGPWTRSGRRASSDAGPQADADLGRLAQRLESDPLACLRSLGLAG